MAIKNTRDVLDYVREYHKKLSDFYHKLADQTHRERVKILLDYMARHERHFEESLAAYEKDASKTVMDSWLQCAPDIDIDDTFTDVNLESDMSVDDVVNLAVKFDNYVIELYKKIADSCELTETKNVFTKLLEMENHEKYNLVRQAMRLNDL